VQLNFFTHMMHNACKYDNDDQCDVEASALPHFHAETLDEYKDTLLIPLRLMIGMEIIGDEKGGENT
jgi:hypothetical protein